MSSDKRVSRDTKGLFQRKPGGVWYIEFRGPRADGTDGQVRQSTGTRDRKKAEGILKQKARQAENSKEGIPGYVTPRAEKLTVSDLCDLLERHYETVQVKGLRQEKVHIRPIREFFGAMRAVALARMPAEVDRFIEQQRRQGYAPATIDHQLEKLRRCFTLAMAKRLLAESVSVPKLLRPNANAREGFWERAELESVLARLKTQLLRDITLFAHATGMRQGSILSLTWSGYDRETRMLRLHPGRSKNDRGVVIPLEAWPVLAQVIDRRLAARRLDSDLIFHNGNGGRVGSIYGRFQRTSIAAGVGRMVTDDEGKEHYKGKVFHDFRRSAIRNMVRAGIPQAVAKKISGHKTDAVFERYNITDERDLEDAFRKRAAYEESLPKTAQASLARIAPKNAPTNGADS